MENELVHHGILGMKWGVRRTLEQLGHKREKKGEKKGVKQEKTVKANNSQSRVRTKNVKKMTDQELNEAIARLMKEQQYSRLNPSALERGKAATMAAIGLIGTAATVTNSIIQIRNNAKTIRKWEAENRFLDGIHGIIR